jgi:hypothetical protein
MAEVSLNSSNTVLQDIIRPSTAFGIVWELHRPSSIDYKYATRAKHRICDCTQSPIRPTNNVGLNVGLCTIVN